MSDNNAGSMTIVDGKFLHDEWCHWVIEGDACSCHVAVVKRLEEENAQLKAENKALGDGINNMGIKPERSKMMNDILKDVLDAQAKLVAHFSGLCRETVGSNVAFQRALEKARAFLSEEEYVQVIEVFNETLALIKSWGT